jgi:hypothetical protein
VTDPLAGGVYDVALVAPSQGPLRRRAAAGARTLTAALSGWIEGPSVGEVVVRRRAGFGDAWGL